MSDSYQSIKDQVQGELKDRGSKFLSFAFPVSGEAEVKAILSSLREKYWDASHHCYAYMLGASHSVFRANDDGEPSHSAGDPILSQIRSFKVSDILVVVVRYFGGTKLGVSGLIAAYRSAAFLALEQATIIEKLITVKLMITFSMAQTSIVMKTIRNSNAEIKDQQFDHEKLKNVIILEIRESHEQGFKEHLQNFHTIEITRSV